jgi:N-methylhydantoinase B
MGINVVMNYTHAYSTFAIRSCLNPELPNNHGSLAPIKVTAPKGSIVNAGLSLAAERPPRRGHVRADADPEGAAPGHSRAGAGRRFGRGMDRADPGQTRQRRSVHLLDVQLFRRHGRARDQAGPSATCYPTGVAAVPVEILEAAMPIVFDRRALRPGSGGKGRSRGGDGQIIEFHMRTEHPGC